MRSMVGAEKSACPLWPRGAVPVNGYKKRLRIGVAGRIVLLLDRWGRKLTRWPGWFFLHTARLGSREWNPLRIEAWFWGRQDPFMRRGMTFALVLHALVIFLPLLWMNWAHVQRAYGLPKGSGTASVRGGVEMVLVRPPKKQPAKKRKKFTVNPHSSIIFYSPNIENDSKVMEETQVETARTYVATGGKRGGKWGGKGGRLGKGGGAEGGWPEGMEGAKVRFIRLQYRGGDWDYRTGSDADFNMLRAFAEITGFQVESFTENIPIDDLKQFPKDHAPPFVYITGTRGMELSPAEAKVLRWYLLDEGGMLWADSGSFVFDQAFRAALRQACPELAWADVPNDDAIYQQPFEFPNGAPALFHHAGNRGLGLRYNDRWVVYYHPGDLGDAWRNDRAGMDDAVVARAFKLGVNIMNYAFNTYTDLHPAK